MDKEAEFARAMDRYYRNPFYNKIGLLVSTIIVTLQVVSLAAVQWSTDMVSFMTVVVFVTTYVVTDFVNGLVHMVMDNSDDYDSIIGPLVASFHLHHKKPKYTDRHWALIYFLESGMKNWLVVYLGFLVTAQSILTVPPLLSFALVMFGIFSSLAEVSHYLCHNSQSRLVRLLQKMCVLLGPEHHDLHHTQDNKNYAFLNGITDPALNWIAKHAVGGYVHRTDLHWKSYEMQRR